MGNTRPPLLEPSSARLSSSGTASGEPPHPHLALTVDAADLLRFQARLRASGVPTDGPRRLGPPGHASVYFADPFGNSLELVTTGYEGAVQNGPPEMSALGHEWEARG